MDTAALRAALDRAEEALEALEMRDGYVDRTPPLRAVRDARDALDANEQAAAQTTVSTAEDAFGEILGVVTAVQKSRRLLPEQTDRLIAMVRVGIDDLHTRPQGELILEPPPEPWHRIRLVELALRWAETDSQRRELLDRARDLEAYVTGEDPADGG